MLTEVVQKISFSLLFTLIFTSSFLTIANIDFLALSDVHVSTKPDLYPEMQRKTYLLPQIEKYISRYNIQAFLMPGDLTTDGDQANLAKDNLELFQDRWFTPIHTYLGKNVKGMLISSGNHDFDAKRWPNYPRIIEFINENYAKHDPIFHNSILGIELNTNHYRYAVDINGLLFISLGYGPCLDSLYRSTSSFIGETLPRAGTNEWLKLYLDGLASTIEMDCKKRPLILFFHVPVAGPNFGFMGKKAMLEFYGIIKDYNVKAIIVGHTHSNSSLNFKGFWQIDVSGTKFLHASYDLSTDKLVGEFVDKDGNTESISMPSTPDETGDYYEEV